MSDMWSTLASKLSYRNRLSKTTSLEAIDEFKRRSHFELPESYRSFVLQFGPGELGRCFWIAAPGYTGLGVHKYNLNSLNESVRLGRRDFEEYCENPEQFSRAVFFATDVSHADFFWDPSEQTDAQTHECKIYALHSDWEIRALATTFGDFITKVCLGQVDERLYEDEPQLVFEPAPS